MKSVQIRKIFILVGLLLLICILLFGEVAVIKVAAKVFVTLVPLQFLLVKGEKVALTRSPVMWGMTLILLLLSLILLWL